METRERRRRTFTPEFDAEVVEQCLVGDRTIFQVAGDRGLVRHLRPQLVNQAAIDAEPRTDSPAHTGGYRPAAQRGKEVRGKDARGEHVRRRRERDTRANPMFNDFRREEATSRRASPG